MESRVLTEQTLTNFRAYLIREEKSAATVEKYMRDTRMFFAFAGEQEVTKERIMAWKESLMAKHKPGTVNGKLSSVNSLLCFLGWENCRVKNLKIQKQTYCPEEKELTRAEYMRLLKAAKDQPQLRMVMVAICSAGIRVSELQFFTVEAVKAGAIHICNKGKNRSILIPGKLKKLLLDWAKKNGIRKGMIFVTRGGKPLDRSNIWARMKKLCEIAGVAPGKVFPHNLRKLFARCHYNQYKDVAKLADILGHSNINTTRIYIMTTGREQRQQMDELGLVA